MKKIMPLPNDKYPYFYNKGFNFLSKLLLGTAPTCLSAIFPSLKNKKQFKRTGETWC